MPKVKSAKEKVEVEPGAEKRLANILKKALNTPPEGSVERRQTRRDLRDGKAKK
jgi:hypothetical protein